MAKGDVHVTWREDEAKWAVQKEGSDRASSLHETKEPAPGGGSAGLTRSSAALPSLYLRPLAVQDRRMI